MAEATFYIQDWRGWTQAAPITESKAPQLLKRRITAIGRTALELAWDIPNAGNARYIFSSRHGEFERTLSLFRSVAQKDDLSPADFTLSVHHALIGLLSIAQKNRRGHIAIAAGSDSFCAGLIEAAACLAEDPATPVLLIHCDDFLPPPYDAFAGEDDQPVAVALELTASPAPQSIGITLSWNEETSSQVNNHAAAFLKFLAGGAATGGSQSAERSWKWTRHAAT